MTKILPAFILIMAFTCTKGYAQFTTDDFGTQVPFTTLKYPLAVKTADLNGDGKPDLIVANEGGNKISVFKNTATAGLINAGSFAARQDFDIAGVVGPESLSVADIDGDGKPDIVVSNFNDKTISVLINNSASGNISFLAKINTTAGLYSHAIALADVDGDGKTDLAVSNYDASSVTIYRNTSTAGTATFAAGYDILCAGAPGAVSLTDITGDSKPELVLLLNNNGQMLIYKNKAVSGTINSTSFEPAVVKDAGRKPTGLAIADINADGKPEILVSNLVGDPRVLVFKNTFSTVITFDDPVIVPVGKNPYSIAVKDIDGDAKPDIAVTSWHSSGMISVLRNISGAGAAPAFNTKVDFATGVNPQSVMIDDIDADNKQDLIVANSFDGTVGILKYSPVNAPQSVFPESTASQGVGSFITTDILDPEWSLQVPPGYAIAADNGTTVNAAGNAGTNAGRFVYFKSLGLGSTSVPGNLTFSAKGTGTLEVKIIAAYNNSVAASTTFTLNPAQYQDFNWTMAYLYPNVEYILAFIFNGPSSSQAQATFKKNICLNLKQCGLRDNFMRFRADITTLIGNNETAWYGWSDQENITKKKYLQHSAYARMRFQTDATKIVIEYVRDFYDSRIMNMFPLMQAQNGKDWDTQGKVVNGNNVINNSTKILGGKTYTISGLKTTTPSYVWFSSNGPLGPPQNFTNIGTAGNPVYQITAPAEATRLGLLVQRITNTSNFYDPINDTFNVYVNCMIQEGAVGTPTAYDGPVPTPYVPFAGYTPARISGPAVFVNGKLYKYYQVEGNDIAKIVSFVSDDLPAGAKTVEVMMPGQGTLPGYDPKVRRSGTYLRAVYFPNSNTTVVPASATPANGSVAYIHDSILSGYNISTSAQSNVWMMKVKYDPVYGGVFTGDIFSEGYAGRILHTNTSTAADITTFAQKLALFNIDKYWFQIGVNDYGFTTPLHLFYNEYKSLIEQLKTLRPNAKIYIQAIGPDSYEGPNAETYADDNLSTTGPTADDYRDVQRLIATTHSYCEYVDFEDLFVPSLENLADGIHPSDAGNALYANGIRDKSTLLGTVLQTSLFDFYRTTMRSMVKGVPSISMITAKGGVPPYTFTKVSGTLPAGLTFNANGSITGTATVATTASLSIKVTDNVGAQVTKSFTLTVNPNDRIIVSPTQIIGAVKSAGYSKVFKGALGYGKYSVALTSGTLPPGLTFNPATATLSGTPTTTGNYTFTLTATDHWGFTGNSIYNLNVGTTTPAALSDHFYPTAVLNGNNVMVTGHLHDLYKGDLYTYIYVYATQNNVERAIGGGNVNVYANTIDGAAFNLGAINPAYGSVTSFRLANLGINPSTIDNVNITYDANTNILIAIP
jgi:lysophospholipase L1-like esterase